MTEAQRDQIIKMRNAGQGYKLIASEVGLSRDVVRNYCKRHNLLGYGKAVELNVKERIENGEACMYCGAEIKKPKTGRPKKFCSEACRRKWWKMHPELINKSEAASYQLTCANCGREFISYGNKARKYCSHDCYIKDRFWREEQDAV